jgi:hypothetical protein
MTARAPAALICVLGALLGCNRSSGPPDANYQQASRMYQQLYAQKLDDAYGEPQMDEVVSLLHRVDKHSIDAPAAHALLAAIEDGRKRFEAARGDREQTAPPPVPSGTTSTIDPSAILASGRDARPPQDPYGAGASIADMSAASGGCLVASEQFHENGTNMKGTIYRMSSSPACAEKLAGFVGQAALVVDGKLYRRVAESEVPRPPPPPAPPPAPAAKQQPKPAQASAASETRSN